MKFKQVDYDFIQLRCSNTRIKTDENYKLLQEQYIQKGYNRRLEILERKDYSSIIPQELNYNTWTNEEWDVALKWMTNHFESVEHTTGASELAEQFQIITTFTSVGPFSTVQCIVCKANESLYTTHSTN